MKRVDSYYYQLSDYERMLPDGSLSPLLPRFMSRTASEYLAYVLISQVETFRTAARDQETADAIRRCCWIADIKHRAAMYAITEASPSLRQEIDRYQNFGGEFFLLPPVTAPQEAP